MFSVGVEASAYFSSCLALSVFAVSRTELAAPR